MTRRKITSIFTAGNNVIEEERRRLYDLKLKAAQEVKAQWEEKKQRESNNYKSFNSLESEDSSVTSSDAPSEKETRWVKKFNTEEEVSSETPCYTRITVDWHVHDLHVAIEKL